MQFLQPIVVSVNRCTKGRTKCTWITKNANILNKLRKYAVLIEQNGRSFVTTALHSEEYCVQ